LISIALFVCNLVVLGWKKPAEPVGIKAALTITPYYVRKAVQGKFGVNLARSVYMSVKAVKDWFCVRVGEC
jgi:hypothetical protein